MCGMETMNVDGYGCVVSWDGETLRARGTNKGTHRALMGMNHDMTEDDAQAIGDRTALAIAKQDKARLSGVVAASAQGLREAVSETLRIPAELVLARGEFTVDRFRKANMAVNGNLILRTNNGVKYQLHFRRKHNAGFEALHAALV